MRRSPLGPVNEPRALLIPASVGEVIDKITILQLKREHLQQQAQLQPVSDELAALEAVLERHGLGYPVGALAELGGDLAAVNRQLWQVEDALRRCEQSGSFGAEFVALARSVYQHNDRRAAIKRRINERSGSLLMEQKIYPNYPGSPGDAASSCA